MPNPKMNEAEQDRVSRGQSIAKGDTGDGATGVPQEEQGISNRPGDTDPDGQRDERFVPDDEDDLDDDADEGTSEVESEPDKA